MLNYLYTQAPQDGTYIGMVQTALARLRRP